MDNKPTWISYALADLHVGNPRLDPFHFQACIEKYVIPQIQKGVNHLFICGDYFDMLINMNSAASMIAVTVISELKKACYENGVKLRVLRGTFTHDRQQPKHFLVTSPEYNACVKLFDTLSIEYDEESKMTFLYMPDNLKYADIYEEVEHLLEAHHLEKVDVVIHHGYFKHMLPPGLPEPFGTLDYEKFKKYYSGCVLNGHVHVHSIFNNVISVGSFDRMAYAEEEAKGFFKISKNEEGVYSFEFIENKDAHPYWTVDMRGFHEDHQKAFDWFTAEWMPKLSAEDRTIHIRIQSDDPGIVEGCKQIVTEKLNRVIVDRQATTKREQIISNLNLELSDLPEITPENLGTLLLDIIKDKHPNVDLQECLKVIESLKEGKL